MALRRMQEVPGKELVVHITQKSADAYDMPLIDVIFIGRVDGRIQRR